MSEKTDFFDEIIDEKTVEKISEDFPVLSDEEKERIFSAVERKLNIDNAVNTDHSEEVSGVEEYIRPRWLNFISVAASAAVLFGGIGGSLCLMHNMKNGISEDPTPEVTSESVSSPAETPFVSVNADNAAEKDINSVPKTIKAVNDKPAEKAEGNAFISPAVAVVSSDNDETSAEEQATVPVSVSDINEAEPDESAEIIQTDEPITTAVTAVSRESIQTTAVMSTYDYEKLVDTAEKIIDDYDSIRNITDLNLPVIEGSNITVIREMMTPSGDGVYNRMLEYGQVDPDIYSDMQSLKESFYSVMCSSVIENEFFGDVSYSGFSSENIVVDHEYSYITYDGKLYRLLGKEEHELEPLHDKRVVVYNVSEFAFTAEKNYVDLTDGSIVKVKFGIVRDYKANKWSLLNVLKD